MPSACVRRPARRGRAWPSSSGSPASRPRRPPRASRPTRAAWLRTSTPPPTRSGAAAPEPPPDAPSRWRPTPSSSRPRRPAPEAEPAAPDAEPASEWDARDEPRREPVAPGVEPVRAGEQRDPARAWQPPGVEPMAHDDDADDEPAAPDAEPAVEWATPARGPDEPAPFAAAAAEPEAAAEPAAAAPPPQAAAEPEAPAAAAGPTIVPAARPPARGLMVGSTRRDYPLLRGAIVKLAHDDPALAGRVLAALLPAQGLAVSGPLSYDLSIGGTGTFSVSVTAGRTFVRAIEKPRPRGEADFHLTAAPLVLAELLAGVDHRVGRFFGPARDPRPQAAAKALRALPTSATALAAAARAGACSSPSWCTGRSPTPSTRRGPAATASRSPRSSRATGRRPGT